MEVSSARAATEFKLLDLAREQLNLAVEEANRLRLLTLVRPNILYAALQLADAGVDRAAS